MKRLIIFFVIAFGLFYCSKDTPEIQVPETPSVDLEVGTAPIDTIAVIKDIFETYAQNASKFVQARAALNTPNLGGLDSIYTSMVGKGFFEELKDNVDIKGTTWAIRTIVDGTPNEQLYVVPTDSLILLPVRANSLGQVERVNGENLPIAPFSSDLTLMMAGSKLYALLGQDTSRMVFSALSDPNNILVKFK